MFGSLLGGFLNHVVLQPIIQIQLLTSNQVLEVAVEYLLHVGLVMSELHLFS